MPVKVSYPGYSSEAEYRAALAEQLAAKAAYQVANDSRFDAAVRRLAPIISELRKDTAQRSTRKLAERLKAMGPVGPNGIFATHFATNVNPSRKASEMREISSGQALAKSAV